MNYEDKFKKTGPGNYSRFLMDFLIVPLIFFAIAYFVFNKFNRINFIVDDLDYLPYLKELVSTKEGYCSFIQTFAMRAVSFKPMSLGIDWVINFSLFGLNPHNYHVFNIILLAVNSGVLYFFIATVFRQRFLGLIISLCYLTHPFNIDGMAWISAGFTSQNVVLFCCLTLITYFLYLKKLKRHFLYLSYLFFFFAFLSREDVIMLPLLIVFFLLFLGRWEKTRIKEILGYLAIVTLIMATRYVLLYPHVFETYRWDFTNIQNALLRNKHYLDLAFSPLKNLFGQPGLLEKNKILLILLKTSVYLFLTPVIFYKIFKYRRSSEIRLLGCGVAWYCLLSIPFNFLIGSGFMDDRYLSLSIIGILMAQIAVITITLKAFLKNPVYIKFILACFSITLLLTCNYMIIEGFNKNYWFKSDINNQYYIATINLAIKNNPNIKSIRLAGFPEVERFPQRLSLYADYKNLNVTNIAAGEKNEKDNASTLTIKYRKIPCD